MRGKNEDILEKKEQATQTSPKNKETTNKKSRDLTEQQPNKSPKKRRKQSSNTESVTDVDVPSQIANTNLQMPE